MSSSSDRKYSSADFHKTPPRPQVVMPERLAHPQVEQEGPKGDYSRARKHPVFFVDLPSHAISMTIGWLDPGQSSNRHRHTYETLVYILEGEGYSYIGGRRVAWKQGDAVYVPVWAWHNHVNTGTAVARYLACENAPMLQNLGGIALREEVPDRGDQLGDAPHEPAEEGAVQASGESPSVPDRHGSSEGASSSVRVAGGGAQ